MEVELVTLVRRRFPTYGVTVDERIEQDADFRETCADYLETVRALAYWAARSGISLSEDELLSNTDQAQENARWIAVEYWVILLALEWEILRYLEPPGVDQSKSSKTEGLPRR